MTKCIAVLFIILSIFVCFESGAKARMVYVSDESGLQAAVYSIASGDTINLAAGEYYLTQFLIFGGGISHVALVGVHRDSVFIIGPGMANHDYGMVPHLIAIMDARYIYISELTLSDVYYHPLIIQAEEGAFAPHLNRLHILNAGEQFIKVTSAEGLTSYCDSGLVENCTFEYTDRARWWYTNGVDILATADWIIRDNLFLRIRGPEGELCGPAILAWQNAIGTVVERNIFIECDFGISMGNSAGPGIYARDGETVYDNKDCIVRNNFIYRAGSGDVGITLNKARNAKVYNNTVILNGTFPWNIEYRFGATDAEIYYNLTDGPIFMRDAAAGAVMGNIDYAELSWFQNPEEGDLHLIEGTPAGEAGGTLPEVYDDIDGDARPLGSAPEVGADEFSSGSSIDGLAPKLPEKLHLQCYPNPFNRSTTITLDFGSYANVQPHSSCRIPAPAGFQMRISNINGGVIATLPIPQSGGLPAQSFTSVQWKPRASIPSGVYLITADFNGQTLTERIVYLK